MNLQCDISGDAHAPASLPQALRRVCGSLKFKLAAASLAALVIGIGVTTAALSLRAEHETLNERRQLEISESARAARLLELRVAGQLQALAVVAEQMQEGWSPDPDRLAAALQAQPGLRAQFDAVFVATPDGRLRAFQDEQGPQRPDVSLSDRDYFRRTLAEKTAVVSDPVVGRVSAEPVIVMTQPLLQGSRVVGVLAGSVRLKSRALLAGVAEVMAGDEGALVVVTDKRGYVLAHPRAENVGAMMNVEPRLAQALAQLQARDKPIDAAGVQLASSDSMVAVASVAGPGWLVWRSRLNADVLAPLAAGRATSLRWAAAVMAVLAPAMLLLLAWLLRPLAALERRAERLFEAGLAPEAEWPRAGGEIGRLEAVLRRVGDEHGRLEASQRQVLQQFESVMSAAPVGIAFTRAGRFELVSRNFCVLMARTEPELVGSLTSEIYQDPEDHGRLGPLVGAAFAAGQAYAGEWTLVRGNGSVFQGRLSAQPVDWKDAKAGTIWTLNDITLDVAVRERLEWAATHEPLTGLANRKALDQRLNHLFAAMPRSMPAALVLFDLDRFKPINDQHGHAAGDAMLRAVAEAVNACVRGSDLVVRMGGDEFAVLLERCPTEVALRLAEDLRKAIATIRLPWEGQQLGVGASLGVSVLSAEIASPAQWLVIADRACYEAKSAGRDRVCVADGHSNQPEPELHAAD